MGMGLNCETFTWTNWRVNGPGFLGLTRGILQGPQAVLVESKEGLGLALSRF